MKYTIEFLKQAYKASLFNKSIILNSQNCAYFCCEEIEEKDTTAICPKCEIDAIIDNNFPINDPIFLAEMSKYWFE